MWIFDKYIYIYEMNNLLYQVNQKFQHFKPMPPSQWFNACAVSRVNFGGNSHSHCNFSRTFSLARDLSCRCTKTCCRFHRFLVESDWQVAGRLAIAHTPSCSQVHLGNVCDFGMLREKFAHSFGRNRYQPYVDCAPRSAKNKPSFGGTLHKTKY